MHMMRGMRMVTRTVLAFLLVLLVLPVAPAFADGPDDGKVVFGGIFTLEAGETLDGDLAVFGGSAVLEAGSRVDGDVAVMGGSLRVAGDVDGDVVIFGGTVTLEDTAVVDGDLVTFGGTIHRREGAVVRGQVVEGVGPDLDFGFFTPLRFAFPGFSWPFRAFRWYHTGEGLLGEVLSLLFSIMKAVVLVVTVTVLAVLIVLFWPKPTEVVAQAALQAPIPGLGVGLLTATLAASLILLLVFTICFSPLALLVGVVWLVAALFGWAAVGLMVGRRLLAALNVTGATPVLEAGVGTLLLSLLTVVPCLGLVVFLGVGCLGLGAVVLTRFGTIAYPAPTSPAPGPLPPAVPTPPEPPVPAPAEEGEEGEEAPAEPAPVEAEEEGTPAEPAPIEAEEEPEPGDE